MSTSATPGSTDLGQDHSAAVELAVGGMTCASCAMRIEKKLNRLDGVTATVNYAIEMAAVRYDPSAVSLDELVSTVEATGYTARLPRPRAPRSSPTRAPRPRTRTRPRRCASV